MVLLVLFAIGTAASEPTEAAAEATGAILWRTLRAGDTPEQTKFELESMPEVQRVKNEEKKGSFFKQDINMNEGGVPILGGHFSVTTGYRKGALSGVVLESGEGCANESYLLASKIEAELQKKYPTIVSPMADSLRFDLKSLAATSTQSQSLTSIYRNDEVVVMLNVKFLKMDPPRYYGGSALNRLTYNIARTAYDARSNSCGGTGYRTSIISLGYLPRGDYEEIDRQNNAEEDAQKRQAAENL